MNLDAGPYAAVQVPEDQLVVASGRMLSACLLAGLAVQDAEDLCQDIWEWLLNSDNLAMATLAPWLGAVVANFLLRFLRRRWQESRLFRQETDAGCESKESAVEARLFLQRLASRSPVRDRKLLELLGAGYRLSEAARIAGIPHGSEQFHLSRIRELANRLRRVPLRTRVARPLMHSGGAAG